MTRNLKDLPWPAHTERLQIRPATPSDAEVTWQWRRLERVARWITSAPTDRDEYARTFADPPSLAKTLIIEREGVPIGDLMLAVHDGWAQTEVIAQARGVQAELGWTLHPKHSGAGYATEAVSEMLRICFADLGLRRVTANCFAANEASWRLMERIGLRRESYSVADGLHRSGQWLDGMTYALLAEEWRATRGIRG